MGIRRQEKTSDLFNSGKFQNLSDSKILALLPNGRSKKNGLFLKNGKIVRKTLRSHDPEWAVIDPLLGRTSDVEIAKFFGIHGSLVKMRRELLHILPYGVYSWEILDPLFAYGSDKEIYNLFDGHLSMEAIKERRFYLEEGDSFKENRE